MTHPHPVTGQELAQYTGQPVDSFDQLLAEHDQDQLYADARAELVAGVWDQGSPINGVDARSILDSLDVPEGGAVVTIGGHDGSVMILQPFDPNQPGMIAIPREDAQTLAESMADNIAAERARAKVLALVQAKATGGGGNTPTENPTQPTVDLEPLQAQLAVQTEQLNAQAQQLAEQDELLSWLVGFVTTGEAPE